MDRRLLRKFDRIIKVLNESKEQYRQREYSVSYTLSQEAALDLRRLEDHLSINVICGKKEEDGDRSKLKGDEKARLTALNGILTELEKKINNEVEDIIQQNAGKNRMGGDQLIQDYEIEVKVSYYLDKNDPQYSDDRDNIMAECRYCALDKKRPLFDLAFDRNDMPPDFSNPLNFRPHCYTFHELYDHTVPRLAFRDLLRIGMIWTEIIVHDQRFTYLADFPEYTGKHQTELDRNKEDGVANTKILKSGDTQYRKWDRDRRLEVKKMGRNTVLRHVRDVLEKAGIRTSGNSPFWEWMHPESKKEDAKGEWDGIALHVRNIPAPVVAPVDIAEIRLSVGDYGIYFAFTLYFYTVLKDVMEVEDFRRIHDMHEVEWFPKLKEYYLDVSTRFSLVWDVEHDESIEDTLYRTFAISDIEEIVEAVKTIQSIA